MQQNRFLSPDKIIIKSRYPILAYILMVLFILGGIFLLINSLVNHRFWTFTATIDSAYVWLFGGLLIFIGGGISCER